LLFVKSSTCQNYKTALLVELS